MGSSSYASPKMAAMFVLALFVGQLLIAEPAAAECDEANPSPSQECWNCIVDCQVHCHHLIGKHDPECIDVCVEANCQDIP